MSFLKKLSKETQKYNSEDIYNFYSELSKIEKKISSLKIEKKYEKYLKEIWKLLGNSSYDGEIFDKNDVSSMDYDKIMLGHLFENINLKNFERELMILWEQEHEGLSKIYSYKDIKHDKYNDILNILLYNSQPLWWRPFFEYTNTGLSKMKSGNKEMYLSSIEKNKLDESMKIIKKMIANKKKILSINSYSFVIETTSYKTTFLSGQKKNRFDIQYFKIDNNIETNLDKFFEKFITKTLNLKV